MNQIPAEIYTHEQRRNTQTHRGNVEWQLDYERQRQKDMVRVNEWASKWVCDVCVCKSLVSVYEYMRQIFVNQIERTNAWTKRNGRSPIVKLYSIEWLLFKVRQ